MNQHPRVKRKHQNTDPTGAQRINKILSLAGLSSRRKADELIRAGRVMLNGHIVKKLGSRAIWGKESIKVNGKEIPGPSERIYLMLNKPFGYISSLNDPEGRPVAVDLLKDLSQRVYSVGRLDFDSLGLLMFTNDGEFSHRLTHPRYHVPRIYKVTVEGLISEDALKSLKNGVQLDDGFSSVAKAVLLKQHEGKSLLRLTVTQGRTRMVRRIIEAVGYRVIHLIRTGFGSLELGDLKIGEYRRLETHEVRDLKKSVGMS
ncbi:MAG: rRNA pseudouridine synthase [Deltaproteobacteria bacterium]|nr:rRNA pseudouridine synthase [Deltaproteobacteria bacterium]